MTDQLASIFNAMERLGYMPSYVMAYMLILLDAEEGHETDPRKSMKYEHGKHMYEKQYGGTPALRLLQDAGLVRYVEQESRQHLTELGREVAKLLRATQPLALAYLFDN